MFRAHAMQLESGVDRVARRRRDAELAAERAHFAREPVKFEPIAAAVKDIGYQGWIVMETSDPSKNAVADARRNADYIRKLFGMS